MAGGDLTFSGIALTPQSRAVPGGLLMLQASVGNVGDALAEGTVVVTIDELPKLQSARRVVVVPGQQEQLDVFVQLPEAIQELKSIHLTATMIVRFGGREVILERKGAPVRHTMTMEVTAGRTFGMAMQPDPLQLPPWYWPKQEVGAGYEFAVAARLEAGHDRIAATFDDRSLPLNQSNWASLDVFVIEDPSVLEDGAAVESMRRYLASGGRLWIMLDRVPCALVRPLLGPGQLCEEVERIELNEFVVELTVPGMRHSEEDRRVASEPDLSMVRVVQEGGEARFVVEDWPAAIEMNIGYGQLVMTTIDSRAWIEPRTKQIKQDALYQSPYQPRVWASYFAIDSNDGKAALPLAKQVEYPLQHIGNPVVPRGLVAAALLGFCVSLAGLSVCLAYWGRLPGIGLAAPIAAILVSLALIGVANWTRRDIPECLSRFQIVDIGSDGSSALVREQAAVYLESAAAMQLESKMDGVARTSEAITTGVRRFVQDDFQHWFVSNDAWPPSSWRYNAEYSLATEQLVVRGTLSKSGLRLELPIGMPSRLEDPVLSFAMGAPMLCDPIEDDLMANNQIKVEGDRWISGSFLSDEQHRRLGLYKQFFKADEKLRRPVRRLYGWTDPWEGASWNRELEQFGSALVALPVSLSRPEIGAEIFVPHGLIQLRRDPGPTGVTLAYDDRTGEWRKDVSSAAEAHLQFVLPSEVVPIQAASVDLELDIKAPQRVVTLSVQTGTEVIQLAKLESPSIPWMATITDAAILETISDGTLEVLLQVSESNQSSTSVSANLVLWQVDHFHASVRGKMSAQSSLSE